MSIIDPHFTMPGQDMPPQEFLDIKTQQGQINWLAQAFSQVNEAEGIITNATASAHAESIPYNEQAEVDLTFTDNNFDFGFRIPSSAPFDEHTTRTFPTLSDLQSYTELLAVNDVVFVAGYAAENDGGSRYYTITDTSGNETVSLSNGMYAQPLGDFQIVNTIEEARKTTADKVFVIDNHVLLKDISAPSDSPSLSSTEIYCDNKNCLYITRPGTEEIYGGIKRADDSIIFPAPDQQSLTSNAPMNSICKCIASYANNPDLIYGQSYNLFQATCTNEIDCIGFTTAIMYGINYNLSRYVLGTNAENVFGDYCTDLQCSTRGTYLMTFQNFIGWLAVRKRLFTTKKGTNAAIISNIQPGDIIFSRFDKPDVASGYESYKYNYYGINHCGIVLQINPLNGHAVIAQGGSFRNDYTYNNAYLDINIGTSPHITILDLNKAINDGAIEIFAKPDYKNIDGTPFDVTPITTMPQSTVNANTALASSPFRFNIKNESFYTLTIEGDDIPSSEKNLYLRFRIVYTDNSTLDLNPQYREETNGKKHSYLLFVPKSSKTPVKYCRLVIVNYDADNAYTTLNISKASIVEGFAPLAPTHEILPFTKNESFSGTVNIAGIWKNDKVIIQAVINATLTGAEQTLGTLSGLKMTRSIMFDIHGTNPTSPSAILGVYDDGMLTVKGNAEAVQLRGTFIFDPTIL